LTSGNRWYRATLRAYMLDMEPPVINGIARKTYSKYEIKVYNQV